MRIVILKNADEVGKWAAYKIAKDILDFNPTEQRPYVLGLPTGGTPLKTYKELIKLYNEKIISFKHVITFNMDEYVGLSKEDKNSYYQYMYQNFFKHIDIDLKNTHILDGTAKDLKKECERYEEKIKELGPIHLFMGGVGEDGHIAFNEPGSSLTSRTRDKELVESTILANSIYFDNDLSKVPRLALTVGVGTIMDSNEVMILATGLRKSDAIQKGVEGGVNHLYTISVLQLHPKAIIVLDEEAASDLKVKTYKYFKEIEMVNLDLSKMKEELLKR